MLQNICNYLGYINALSKLFYFGKWMNNQVISDPYKKSTMMYQEVFKLIFKASILWSEKLIGVKIMKLTKKELRF